MEAREPEDRDEEQGDDTHYHEGHNHRYLNTKGLVNEHIPSKAFRRDLDFLLRIMDFTSDADPDLVGSI